jgi:hypothetical protein
VPGCHDLSKLKRVFDDVVGKVKRQSPVALWEGDLGKNRICAGFIDVRLPISKLTCYLIESSTLKITNRIFQIYRSLFIVAKHSDFYENIFVEVDNETKIIFPSTDSHRI